MIYLMIYLCVCIVLREIEACVSCNGIQQFTKKKDHVRKNKKKKRYQLKKKKKLTLLKFHK